MKQSFLDRLSGEDEMCDVQGDKNCFGSENGGRKDGVRGLRITLFKSLVRIIS